MVAMTSDWSVPATTWENVIERYICYRQVTAWRARTRDKNNELVSQCDTPAEAERRRSGLQRAVGLIRGRNPDMPCDPLLFDVPDVFSALRVGVSRPERTTENDIRHLWRAVLFNRDGYTCQYCGRTAWGVFAGSDSTRTLRFEPDHRIPRIDGPGEFDAPNTVTACLSCNRMKAQLTEEQFVSELESLAAAARVLQS